MKGAAKRDTSREPWIENYPPLKEWIDKHEDARCEWQKRVASNIMVEAWRVNGRQLLIVVWSNGNGWHVFTESGNVLIDDYLADVEARIGLKPDPALAALDDFAQWDSGDEVNGTFDDPHAARHARKALQTVRGGDGKPPAKR